MVIFLRRTTSSLLIAGYIARRRPASRDDPAGKTGLGSIVGEVWRTGGTKTKTGDELDDFLEARAAKVETSVGTADATASACPA